MQDFSLRYDETLPAPHVLHCFDGYYLAEINPRRRAELPLWLIELMQNDVLSGVTTGPHGPVEVPVEDHSDNVIDLRPHLSRAVGD